MTENATRIDIPEDNDYEIAAALDQAVEAREEITVTTCSGSTVTYRPA